MKVLPNLLVTLALVAPLTALGVAADGVETESLCPTDAIEIGGSEPGTVGVDSAAWYHYTYTHNFLMPDQHVTVHVAGVGGGWVEAVVYGATDCTEPLDCGREVHYDATIGPVSGHTCTVGPGGHYIQVTWNEPADVSPGPVDYLLTVDQW